MSAVQEAVRNEVRRPASSWVDMDQVLELLRRRWLSLCLGIVVGLAGGALYYTFAAVKYESSAQILVMSKDPQLATRGVNASEQSEERISEDLLATHIQLLQSREIVGQALAENGFDKLPSITMELDTDETPVTFIIDRLNVTRGGAGQSRLAHVLNISLRHTSATESRDILDAVIRSYRKFLDEKFQDVSTEAAELISQAKVELAGDLKDIEAKYRKFRENAPLLWRGEESSNIFQARYEQIQEELSTIRLKRANAEARLRVVDDAIKNHKDHGSDDMLRLASLGGDDIERLMMLVQVERGDSTSEEFQATQPARLEIARTQHQSLMTLLLKEQTLISDLGPDHPQIRDVRAQIRTAKDFLASQNEQLGIVEDRPRLTSSKLVESYRELLRQDIAALEGRQVALAKEAENEQEQAKKLVAYELDDEAMRKETVRKQDLYDAVIDRLREINLVKDYGRFITEVIAPVQVGERASPKLAITGAASLFMGLCCGIALVFAAEYRDRSFHSVDALRAAVDVPILSTVPKLEIKDDTAMRSRVAEFGLSPSLQAFYRPKSREAEVFRGLRTTLCFAARNKKRLVLACTSPSAGDGKSTVTANLAISLAQSGRSVLLVDCDLRRPRVDKLFQVDASSGLVDVLSGIGDPPDHIRATPVENLSILPCGVVPPNPAELLSSDAFKQFLEYARERYEFVLLDCPPVLAVADPCIVSSLADELLLVVRLESATRPQLLRAQDMLAEVGAKPTGIVVNGIVREQTDSGRYAYGYGYGYGENKSYYTSETVGPPAVPTKSSPAVDRSSR
jgi:succinoglycan biosynthesis transport protein ExoP